MATRSPEPPVLEVPRVASLWALARAAAGCRRCDLHARATQTEFGAGPAHAAVMLLVTDFTELKRYLAA